MEKYQNEIYKIFEGVSDLLIDIFTKENVIIAGGIVSRVFSGRKTEGADVDVYFRSRESLARVLYAIEGTENVVVDWTDKSIMIKSGKEGTIIQLIIIDYFQNAHEIFKKFDFTCVMGAYDFMLGEEGGFVFHEDFLLHNAQRKLVYNPNTDFPIISALRVSKYEKEGYKISRNEFVKILISVMRLNICSWEDAEKQFGKFYGTSLSGMITDELKEKDFSIDLILDTVNNFEFKNDKTPPENKKIDSRWIEFVSGITGVKQKAYLWKGNYYSIVDGSYNEILDSNKSFYDLVDEHNSFGCDFSKVYKYVVKKSDGRLVSQYRESFEYKIGENVSDNNYGLWFYYLPGLECAKSNYGNRNDRVLMECELVKVKKEASNPSSDGQAFEILPLRVVSKEEESLLLEKCSKLSFNNFVF